MPRNYIASDNRKFHSVLTDAQRREIRRLRYTKGREWSINGLARRYDITVTQVYAELGETPPNKIAA